MRRGFHVYRALSPACPCDLVAIDETRTIRVEVKTGEFRASGDHGAVAIRDGQRERCDTVAAVFADDSITYDPPIE